MKPISVEVLANKKKHVNMFVSEQVFGPMQRASMLDGHPHALTHTNIHMRPVQRASMLLFENDNN